jgi:GT2 family glycosyltransferase
MLDQSKPVTVILPTYCPSEVVEEYLNRCLTQLANDGDRDLYNLIVVEQGIAATDPVLSTVSGSAVPYDLYIHTGEKPIGAAAAFNLGLRLCETEYVVFMSNDVFVPKHWLSALLSEFRNSERFGMRVGTLAPAHGVSAHVANNLTPWANRLWVEHWAAVYLMKRSQLLEVGTLDDQKLNWRLHDQDQSIRFWNAGYDVLRTDAVVVEHVNMATYAALGKSTEEHGEHEEMRRRWGVAGDGAFMEYIARHPR